MGSGAGRRRRALIVVSAAAALLALALVLTLALPRGPVAAPRAGAVESAGAVEPITDDAVPARNVTMIGATPQEPGAPGPDETWGIGRIGERTKVLARFVGGDGWTLGPSLPSGFEPAEGQLAGQMTPRGAGVLVGTVPASGGTRELVLVRKAGGGFEDTAKVPTAGEEPFASARAPLIAPLDEAGGGAGALVVPVGAAVEKQVLHWNGTAWGSEPIAVPAPSAGDFRVLAIGASAPDNAWLLGQLASGPYPDGAVALFRRVPGPGEGFTWQPVALEAGGGDGEAHPLSVPLQGGASAPFKVAGSGAPPHVRVQVLTVTGEGVWVDGERADVHAFVPATATLFFQPEGSAGGHVDASWCSAGGAPACQHPLPRPLPTDSGRSIAWADGSRFGQRVITGLSGSVSLRLQGEVFDEVLALGAGATSGETSGGLFGAAFSSPTEGWLGNTAVPVHMTAHRPASRLSPWPTPFRRPLLAIAPQPGAPVGSLSSGAVAVGDGGAVARYKPGQGWVPESLFGPGQRVERPRLRAVAWPTPNRIYAVGDTDVEHPENQMWLWRGETGFWERDPAIPANFSGNLLGVAFDPANPARGYAVGTTSAGIGGVLLRYGKSWTQETGLPEAVQNAAFVGTAFAGSQAIVAYRRRVGPNQYVGGLLLNEGSGWHVDPVAAALMGANLPASVAGLPDGGAAFATSGPEGPHVYERQGPGAPWAATPIPLPGVTAGSIALFREGGALRAVLSGGGVGNQTEGQAPPPGAPPNYQPPLSPISGSEGGAVLRQTASGWSDEGHELNPLGPAAGGYLREDLPYRPDGKYAVLVDPSGSQGWAVGGELSEAEATRKTSDIERYPADGVPATGETREPVPATSPEPTAPLVPRTAPPEKKGYATLAFGGNAECAAPCADRSLAGVGPQVWLSRAVALAQNVGSRAFVYTGPSVTKGEVSGPRSLAIPFGEELGRTAAILSAGNPMYVAASAADLDARPEREGTEAAFHSAFEQFPQALLPEPDRSTENCLEVGCQVSYYAFATTGTQGPVRVIVLDDSGDVGVKQLEWLERQLKTAKEDREPAVAVGAADLNAQIKAGDVRAAAVAKVLVTGSATSSRGACRRGECDSASAYFYDSPEANVKTTLASDGEPPIEAFGSGTLGYVLASKEQAGNFHGASGILLGQVDVEHRDLRTNRASVIPRLIPVIGELAMEAKDGTLLHRSQPALFSGLARRPRAGGMAVAGSSESEIDPYIPIPSICVGDCTQALLPEYTFTSSDKEKGDFVKHDPTSPDPRAVKLDPHGEPMRSSQDGLFCAFNPGQTTVKISAGGVTASLVLNIERGSVRQPCGTVKLNEPPSNDVSNPPPPPPPVQPTPTSAAPASSPPPVPLPASPLAQAPTPAAPLVPFIPLAALPAPLIPFVPPPVPTPARPTPPSGTSAVTSPVEAAEQEEEEEEATESVSNQAVAYHPAENEPTPLYVLGVVLLAAFAGAAGARRRPRRSRRGARVAPATVSGARGQSRMSRGGRPPRR